MGNNRQKKKPPAKKTTRNDDLPFEILTTIFSLLDRTDGFDLLEIQQCALTCRSWRSATRFLIFSTVKVRNKKELENIINIVRKDNTVGQLIKTLYASQIALDSKTIDFIAKFFTQLEAFYFSSHQVVYNAIYFKLRDGHLKNLKAIMRPKDKAANQNYLKCIEIMKPRLTDLVLLGEETFGSTCSKLDTFPELRNINIEFPGNTTDSVVDILEGLTQKSRLPSIEIIRLRIEGVPESHRLSKKLKDVKPMTHLSTLEITGFERFTIIDDTLMLYIMKKFPNLERLVILSDFDFHLAKAENVTTLSVDVTSRFFEYLAKVETSIVNSVVTDEKTAAIIKNFCSNIKEESIKFPSLHMGYDTSMYSTDELFARHPIVMINSDKGAYEGPRDVFVTFSPAYFQETFGRDLIEQAGNFFTELTLTSIPVTYYGTILEYIARYCEKLKTLVIKKTGYVKSSFEYQNFKANRSLTHLELQSCDASPKTLSVILELFLGLELLSILSGAAVNDPADSYLALNMPALFVKHLQVELKFYKSRVPVDIFITGICIQLHVGNKFKYFLFSLQYEESGYTYVNHSIKFDREVTALEFKDKESSPYYYVCHILCGSAKRFSFNYITNGDTHTIFGVDTRKEVHEVHF